MGHDALHIGSGEKHLGLDFKQNDWDVKMDGSSIFYYSFCLTTRTKYYLVLD